MNLNNRFFSYLFSIHIESQKDIYKWDVTMKYLPSEFYESCEIGREKSIRLRGNGGFQENETL